MVKETRSLDEIKERYPEKFAPETYIFSHIHRGDRIFVGTGCGEPQYLVRALINYVEVHPKAFFDAEVFQVWSLGVSPYHEEKFKYNFRRNAFFVSDSTRESINQGMADYTPIFLSQVPDLFNSGFLPMDVALIQTSIPDGHGYMSLGVSVDIVKAAADNASLVIAQVNREMPRVHGAGFVHLEDVDFIIPHDEPLLEYRTEASNKAIKKIGEYVAQIVEDGDTLQVGYGRIPNAVLAHLKDKKHLGINTELLSDGIVELMKLGVIDNTKKSKNRGRTVATFCMGSRETYDYIDDNPSIEFRTIDYTNDPIKIAQHKNMVAINSALKIDLTGQATCESIGRVEYSGIGGQADFMRGAVLARGKSILAIQSTADNGRMSRIVPFLKEGASVTLNRGDVHYVVTEYGIAHIHGKNVRERAMDLVAIAHPKFKSWLIEEAKEHNMIYKDQAFIPGKRSEYPEHIVAYRTTQSGLTVRLRPVKISDEPLLKDFFYALSDQTLYRRFISVRKDMPHERLQEFVIIDYTKEMVILATKGEEEKEEVVGIAEYYIGEGTRMAEASIVVRDDCQNRGLGTELLSHLITLAKKKGLLGFTVAVLVENRPLLHLLEKLGFNLKGRAYGGMYELTLNFGDMIAQKT